MSIFYFSLQLINLFQLTLNFNILGTLLKKLSNIFLLLTIHPSVKRPPQNLSVHLNNIAKFHSSGFIKTVKSLYTEQIFL